MWYIIYEMMENTIHFGYPWNSRKGDDGHFIEKFTFLVDEFYL